MLRPGLRGFSLAAALVLAVVSCDNYQPAPSQPSLTAGDLLGSILRLVNCSPLPASSATAVVGPEGGTIVVGPHSLIIPAGALGEAVTITAVSPSATSNHVEFAPEGLTFDTPARLTLSYANCHGILSVLPRRVVYTDDALVILEGLLSLDDRASQSVSADLEHFSKYAVAW